MRVHTDSESAHSAQSENANAYTLGKDIVFGGGRYAPETAEGKSLLAHELAHVVQQDNPSGKAASPEEAESEADASARRAETGERADVRVSTGTSIQKQEAKKEDKLPLLDDFTAKFPKAAKLIKASPTAMTLVKDAAAAGAQFGGFSEDGPSKDTWPYTVGSKVYIPKKRDGALAMSDFLFEVNNAIREPNITKIHEAAAKGKKTDNTAAKKYAHDIIEQEVEGMLKLGEVWFETKKTMGKGASAYDKFDRDFFLAHYKSFKDGKKTKEQIISAVLKWTYSTGVDKGKTHETFYMDQYKDLAQ